jgi:hypothetical protein
MSIKELAAEIRADEHAARIRDYGEADAATYEQRVRDGAESGEGRRQDERVAEFEERIAELRREGIPSYPPLAARKMWEQATETDKLEEIIWNSWSWTWPEGSDIPSGAVLAAIEREVDYAGLPSLQREMLQDLRTRHDTGHLGGTDPNQVAVAAMTLAQIVNVGEFEARLTALKEGEEGPWAELPEDAKVSAIVDLAQASEMLDAHTLTVIEREVDYGKLPPWRRESLERGELGGENPAPAYQGDRTSSRRDTVEVQDVPGQRPPDAPAPADYQQMLDDAAGRGSNHGKGKDGPER